jgi:hypothetical protein
MGASGRMCVPTLSLSLTHARSIYLSFLLLLRLCQMVVLRSLPALPSADDEKKTLLRRMLAILERNGLDKGPVFLEYVCVSERVCE